MAPRDTAAQPSAPADQRDEGDDSSRLLADMALQIRHGRIILFQFALAPETKTADANGTVSGDQISAFKCSNAFWTYFSSDGLQSCSNQVSTAKRRTAIDAIATIRNRSRRSVPGHNSHSPA